eukprot:COSAG04_NODE_18616_length_436_cov_1.964392_2_plen_104_part_01
MRLTCRLCLFLLFLLCLCKRIRANADSRFCLRSVDMIPVMMQKGYKANGWLGLILGTRFYYSFYDAAADDDTAFEKRMEAVVREIGGRGKHQRHVPEAVPPARA